MLFIIPLIYKYLCDIKRLILSNDPDIDSFGEDDEKEDYLLHLRAMYKTAMEDKSKPHLLSFFM